MTLKKLGKNTIIFQLKKLKFLKKSNQIKKIINQYNKIIQSNKRKEFFYYEKAKYLFEIGDFENSNIALQQAKLAIKELKLKFQNTIAIEKLQTDMNSLEIKLRV